MISLPQESFPVGFPGARRSVDYREVFAQHGDEFDAVLCGSTDHHHFSIAELSLLNGKPIYCEKPVCWSPEEGHRLMELAKRGKVATQMGNQGNASNGWRIGDGYYRQGDLGDIVEVHGWVYMDAPVSTAPRPRFPEQSDPVPDYLDWARWLGPAGEYPYMSVGIHPGAWRNWIPFGGGQIGDWGCHVFGGIFKTLGHLGYPTSVEVIKATEFNGESYPEGMTVKWRFPAGGGKPGVDMYFHTSIANDPAFYPPRPAELEAERAWPPSMDGCYWVGTKGTYVMHEGHNVVGALIPEEKRRRIGRPQMAYPMVTGNNFHAHGNEWAQAAMGEREWDDTMSEFVYASKLSAIVQMGNAALRAGHAIAINPETGWPVDAADRPHFNRQNADKDWYSL
jgi:hypothetical protein